MRRWIKNLLGRWSDERYRIKKIQDDYRIMEQNRTLLENGGTI